MTATRFSTLGLADGDRAAAWEAWNRDALVGVRCRTPDGRGLRADQLNVDLPAPDPSAGSALGLARVRADRHEAVRDTALVDAAPTGAAVVYAVLRGRTVFTGPHGSVPLAAGQALVVDGDRPFRRAFPTAFAELVVTVPRAEWATRLGGTQLPSAHPVALSAAAVARAGALARHLACAAGPAPATADAAANAAAQAATDTATDTAMDPAATGVDDLTVRAVALDLLGDLTAATGPGDRLALARLLVEQHLTDPGLGEAALAACLGISSRHLSRLFAAAGTSVPAFVTERRLARAAGLLRDTTRPVAAVAAACGFSSASYFTRVFARLVGETPARYRALGAACTFPPSAATARAPV